MSSLLGIQLKENMSMGLPTRTKNFGDYTGYAMKPCGDYEELRGSSSAPSPWLRNGEDLTNLSLHDEITKFMMYIQPTPQEIDTRNDLVNRFTALIASFKSNATVRPVGSYVTGLFVPTSDIDMVLVPNDALYSSPIFARTKLSSIFYKLQGTGFASKLEDVLQATVPLIRITDKKTGIQIDLTAADTHGIEATKAVQKWTSGEDAEIIKMLVMVVKMFLSIRKCGTTYTGGLNSYVLVWMVVAWVELEWKGNKPQSRPFAVTKYDPEEMIAAFDRLDIRRSGSSAAQRLSLQSIATTSMQPASPRNRPPTDFGKILLQFFRFYGTQFDYYTQAIQFAPRPAYVAKTFPYSRYIIQGYLLAIFDPANSLIDMGSKAYGIKNVQASFKEAYTLLSNTERQYGGLLRSGRPRGLLGDTLGGDFTNFEAKRAKYLRAEAVVIASKPFNSSLQRNPANVSHNRMFGSLHPLKPASSLQRNTGSAFRNSVFL